MFDTLMSFLVFTPKKRWFSVHREGPYTEADFEEVETRDGVREKRESVRARNKRMKVWLAMKKMDRKRELKISLSKEEIRALFKMCPPNGNVRII